jgi:L-aspartate oxidase
MTSSALAQGGLAASIGQDDSVHLHVADTLAAGDDLCDADIVAGIVGSAARIVSRLQGLGVAFDRDHDGSLALALEAAHSRHRILHAEGDASGPAIVNALAKAALSSPSITVLEHTHVTRLLTHDGAISGVVCGRGHGSAVIPTSRVLLATGGLGGLYAATTNPVGNFGHGVALAAEAGAVLSDMEFVQFHPTALRSKRRPLALVSEAIRGEGAILVDGRGRPVMEGVPGGDLAPRDMVARAVAAEIGSGGACYLDARSALGERFAMRFPSVYRLCLEAGIDPAVQPIPITPAAHYHMGGIDVDERGRSSLQGLWASGEVASTGLHGANRLASNSLLEAAVMGMTAAHDIAGTASMRTHPVHLETPAPLIADLDPVRAVVSARLGVLRDGDGLHSAISALLPLLDAERQEAGPATVAMLIAVFAMLRTETRGAHARSDFPKRLPHARRRKMTLSEALAIARSHASFPVMRSA